jgi:tetratricopeptide (TPR) repeat protein
MPLPPHAAFSLLRHASGAKRLAGDLDAALALARLCGHMPLALRCAAGLLAIQDSREVASIAGALEAGHELTGAGPGSEAGIRAVLNLTYAALSPAAARAYRLLSVHPGPDLGGSLAAAMLGTSAGDAAGAIEELRRARLLEDAGGDRFRFHDVILGHALELASHDDPKADRDAAGEQNAGWHLHHAAAAERLLLPCGPAGRRDALDVADCPPEFGTAGQALDWLDRERHNLTAALTVAARCCPQACWQLADALWPLWYYRGHWGEALRTARLGLTAARRCADPAARARLHDRVGVACYHLGLHAEAGQSFRAGQGNRDHVQPGHGSHLRGLTLPQHYDGWIAENAGQWQHAVTSYRDAVSVYTQAGDARQAALAKIDLGRALPRAGMTREAITVLREAIATLDAIPDPYNAARARMVLGGYLLPAEDTATYLLALATMENLGALPEQAAILCALATITGLRGDQDQARAYCQRALAIVPHWHPQAGQIRAALAALPGAGVPQ